MKKEENENQKKKLKKWKNEERTEKKKKVENEMKGWGALVWGDFSFNFFVFFFVFAPFGPQGLHTTARELQTCTFHAPGASKTPPNFNERTPKRGKNGRKLWQEREKSAKFWASHPSRRHPSGLPPFGWPPPFGCPHPSGPPGIVKPLKH